MTLLSPTLSDFGFLEGQFTFTSRTFPLLCLISLSSNPLVFNSLLLDPSLFFFSYLIGFVFEFSLLFTQEGLMYFEIPFHSNKPNFNLN